MAFFLAKTWSRVMQNHVLPSSIIKGLSCNILSRLMTKPTKWLCAQRRQISLGLRPVWSESSLCNQLVVKAPSFLHADSEDSDQTGRMPRLIWVFAGRTCHFVCVLRLTLQLHSCAPGAIVSVIQQPYTLRKYIQSHKASRQKKGKHRFMHGETSAFLYLILMPIKFNIKSNPSLYYYMSIL